MVFPNLQRTKGSTMTKIPTIGKGNGISYSSHKMYKYIFSPIFIHEILSLLVVVIRPPSPGSTIGHYPNIQKSLSSCKNLQTIVIPLVYGSPYGNEIMPVY
jgi:hypothetical protein